MSTKIILGAGLSGLCAAYYNPEYEIISEDIGGYAATDYGKTSVFLQYHKETEELLEDLGIEAENSAIPIHYYKNSTRVKNYSDTDIMKVINSKLTNYETFESIGACSLDDIKVPKLAEDRGDGQLSIINVDMGELVSVLKEKVENRITFGSVSNISSEKVEGDFGSKQYKHLISTIPASIFWKLYSSEHCKLEFKSLPITVAETNTPPVQEKIPEHAIMYFCDRGYHKCISYKEGYFYEFTGIVSDKTIQEALPDMADFDTLVYNNARLNFVSGNIPPKKVMFLGRFAEWNKDHRIENTVKSCLNKYPLSSIWSSQKSFNQRFVDFGCDNNTRQAITKDYIIHLSAEMVSLLNEINWKINKESCMKDINYQKLQEEWIDVYKYWLSIGILWGISPEDFIKAYWNKTDYIETLPKWQKRH
jgi:hypothetical protein